VARAVTRVSRRRSGRAERAGDPLDGLVNMFDVGLVLAVAFLLAALQSANLADLLTKKDVTVVSTTTEGQTIIVKRDQKVRTLKPGVERVAGSGSRVGSVYRLADGRLIYVTGERR
jgi:hypothetical protein